MLRSSLDAFVQRDVERARAIPEMDDEVDHLYNQVYRELLSTYSRTLVQSSRPITCCGPLTIWNARQIVLSTCVSGWSFASLERWRN